MCPSARAETFQSRGESVSRTQTNCETHQPISLNLKDPSGNMVSTLVSPTADTGSSNSWGIDYPHVVFVMRWETDHKLVFLFVNGVG